MNGTAQTPVTQEVYDYLESQLDVYRRDLEQIEDDIKVAAAHGDLRENRAYEQGQEQKKIKQEQIASLERFREQCVVAPQEQRKYTHVDAMTQVTLTDTATSTSEIIYMVLEELSAPGEVDFDMVTQLTPDKVSIASPFGSALYQKPVGVFVKIGNRRYKIDAVEPINYRAFFERSNVEGG